jgi:sugar phosphate isomerase/epimerase
LSNKTLKEYPDGKFFQKRVIIEKRKGDGNMKLGCSSVLFNQLDLYGALQHIAWAGYEGAELAILANHCRHLELITEKSYIDEIKATAIKHGVDLFAIHADVGYLPGEHPVKSVVKLCDIANKLDIPVITMRVKGKSDDKLATEEVFEYLRTIAKEAEKREVTLAIKPHMGASVYNTATLVQMLAEIDSPGLGANLDTLHIFKAKEDASITVRKLGKRLVHVHLREYPEVDETQNYEARPEEKIVGRGGVDFPKILKSLKIMGYTGAIDLDLIGAFTFPLSRQMGIAAESRGYINRCLRNLT